ncbi:hypothetical protein K466DRAFT_262809 [Polyporus arcularius HHB13444]|uniref:Uncharacterized protein n=1 Tax=Polyporus arcularius HHB13444 TaxID=1314778 RepID=A0A5C3P1R9_9APHY|nr:hypothetical protein K466DRAFT_262809 [Polyporus arcularius HHB13444]
MEMWAQARPSTPAILVTVSHDPRHGTIYLMFCVSLVGAAEPRHSGSASSQSVQRPSPTPRTASRRACCYRPTQYRRRIPPGLSRLC